MITVNICGYDSMHKTVYDRLYPGGYEDYVLLLIKTKSFFESEGRVWDMPPSTVMIYGKHSYVHYGCRDPRYNDDWLHFELRGEDSDLLDKLALPVNSPFTLPGFNKLTEYSRLIVQEKLSSNAHKREIIDSLMHTLFYSIADQLHGENNAHQDHKYYDPMQELRMEMLNAPYEKWDTPELASRLHLSVSHFQHLYKRFFGVTCIQDIIHARIKYAKLYLCISEMSVSSLAAFCGYESDLHFMRQFKKATGMTPSQYRETHRHQKGERASF